VALLNEQVYSTNLVFHYSLMLDILVCTPGRLVDHLDRTPGFSLQHLQFLVVDEADRLLNQKYHNWMDRVVAMPSTKEESNESRSIAASRPQLRKFLVSATLTRDPQKLAALRLVNPKHLNAHQLSATAPNTKMYSMPESLQEYTVECTAEQKPLVLLALLLELTQQPPQNEELKNHSLVVVFTASLDATHRLARLLQLLWPFAGDDDTFMPVAEFSSALSQTERSALVRRCNASNDVSVVVCSDGMSRGMDLQKVCAVVHYDVPAAAKTYVHRSGRTARAGVSGKTITLLKGVGQAGQFNKMRRLIHAPENVQAGYKLQKHLVRGIPYRRCVLALREVMEAEESGDLKRSGPLPAQYIPGEDDDE
jgi:ATP-dependent RNA helicase DDX51/DBP6